MAGIKQNRVEETQMRGGTQTGNTLLTVGQQLLWMDFLLLAFVYVGLRSGSDFWAWWVVIEAILGLILMGVGYHKRGSLTE